MSSSSKYGYNSRTSWKEAPEAKRPVIVPTVTLIPRMQGFPPITLGSIVIRSNSGNFISASLMLRSPSDKTYTARSSMILHNPSTLEGEIHPYGERRSIMMTDWYDKTIQALQLNGKGKRTESRLGVTILASLIEGYGPRCTWNSSVVSFSTSYPPGS